MHDVMGFLTAASGLGSREPQFPRNAPHLPDPTSKSDFGDSIASLSYKKFSNHLHLV